jgi:hypothetical protein
MAEHLSSSALRATGIFRPGFLRIAKLLWRLAPRASALHSRLDVLVGAVLAMQILHSLFVAARPPSRADFPMVNRSPA